MKKVYVVWADTYNAPFGCKVSLFGVYEAMELAEKAIEKLEKEGMVGEILDPLEFNIEELNMNECVETYIAGYYE